MYYIYFITNANRTVLYLGLTNDLQRKMQAHFDARGNPKSFAGKYNCHYLIYFEEYGEITAAIAREEQLKRWNRKKKEWLIGLKNPEWTFLETATI